MGLFGPKTAEEWRYKAINTKNKEKKLQLLEKAVELGDAEAAGILSNWTDSTTSWKWLLKGAEMGDWSSISDVVAAYCGKDRDRWEGVMEPDGAKAFQWCQRGLTIDPRTFTGKLSELYRDGIGVEKDLVKSFELCEKAYDLTHNFEARLALARKYLYGEGVAQNIDKARTMAIFRPTEREGKDDYWIDRYEKGSAELLREIETVREQTLNNSFQISLDKLRENPQDAAALAQLSYCYANGKGTEKNMDRAMVLAFRALDADSVHLPPRFPVVPDEDSETAFQRARAEERKCHDMHRVAELYEPAAKAGHVTAMRRLAKVYDDLGRKEGRAELWERARVGEDPYINLHVPTLSALAKQGDPEALNQLRLLYEDREDGLDALSAVFETLAVDIYEQLAKQGDSEACFELSVLYKLKHVSDNDERVQNSKLAQYWGDKAIALGNIRAMNIAANPSNVSYPVQQKKEMAAKAWQGGILSAKLKLEKYEAAEERGRLAAACQAERLAEDRLEAEEREDEMEAYRKKLDDKERWFRLLTEGTYMTNEEQFWFAGKSHEDYLADKLERDVWEIFHDKRIFN